MKTQNKILFNPTDNMIFIGFGLATIYWLLESFLFAMLADDADFFHRLIGFDLSGILMRLLVLCFFMILSSHAQYIMNKRREAEEAFYESEEKYRTIIESSEDGYYEVDLSGNFTYLNNSMGKIIGHSKDEIIGQNLRQFMDDEHRMKATETFNHVYNVSGAVKMR